MKIREIIKLLKADGWYEVESKGGHRQYKHSVKRGRVTVPFHGGGAELPKFVAESILRQAGLK